MLDFTGQSTKIGVFNFIAFFSHSAMYHNCAIVTFNFSVNVKYYKFMGAASPKFYFPFFILHWNFLLIPAEKQKKWIAFTSALLWILFPIPFTNFWCLLLNRWKYYFLDPTHPSFPCFYMQSFCERNEWWCRSTAEQILCMNKKGTTCLFQPQKSFTCRSEREQKNRNGVLFWSKTRTAYGLF
jgi:hypothetical protein